MRYLNFSQFVNEGISVSDEKHFGKKGIIIMIDDNGKKVSAIFKDKKNADKFNRNNPSDIKKLLDLAKKTKYPKAIDESVNERVITLSSDPKLTRAADLIAAYINKKTKLGFKAIQFDTVAIFDGKETVGNMFVSDKGKFPAIRVVANSNASQPGIVGHLEFYEEVGSPTCTYAFFI